MRKFTVYLCALACIASLTAPAAGVNAEAVTKASILSKQEVTPSETLELPVISKVTDSNVMTRQGYITSEEEISYIIDVQTPVYFEGAASGAFSVSGSIYYELKDAEGNLKTNAYISNGEESDSFSGTYLEAGQYILTVENNADTTVNYAFAIYGYDASESGVITEKTAYVGYNNSNVYKKIKITENGCLAVAANTFNINSLGEKTVYGNTVTLCDSNKKPLSEKEYTKESQQYIQYFGVKKGTYYIKISGTGSYTIAAQIAKKGTIPASKKSKAKKITSSNKSYVIPASNKKSTAWFKFTLKKAKKLTFTSSFVGGYSASIELYKGKKQLQKRTLWNGDSYKVKYKNLRTGKETTWPKGTYYVKVTTPKKTDNGLIQLKIK